MTPFIVGLVAVSALLHLAWNVRLKTAGDPLRTATLGLLAACVAIVPLGVGVWWAGGMVALPPEGIALGVASGFVEAAYFILLSAAYRRGDLSVVYPVARGTAPLLAVLIGVGIFGERLGVAGSIGVVMLLIGFLWLQRPWRAIAAARSGGAEARRAAADSAILFALATGVMIATYTAIDRAGTRADRPVPVRRDPVGDGLDRARRVGRGRRRWRPASRGTGGHAQRCGRRLPHPGRVPVHPGCVQCGAPLRVAPLRELATVFAAAWGSVRLGEASDRPEAIRRIGASVLIVGGVAARGGRVGEWRRVLSAVRVPHCLAEFLSIFAPRS